MRLEPVCTPTCIGNQWHFKGKGILHLFEHNLFNLLFLVRNNAKVQFVVYLKNHLALYSFFVESLIDANHCQFDDVCGTTLYRCVDGIALCITTNGSIFDY